MLRTWLPLLVIFHQLSQTSSSFTLGSNTLPRGSRELAVGYDNITDTILLFGGSTSSTLRQFVKFQNHAFIDANSMYLTTSAQTRSTGQQYTQIGNKLWMINSAGTNIFRVDTNTLNEDPHLTEYTIPIVVSHRGCLASYQHYLIVVGGGESPVLNTVQAYNTRNGNWSNNVPSLNQNRRSASCIVIDSILYAIGGFSGSGSLASIEIKNAADISSPWSYLNGALTRPLDGTRAVQYGDDILVIGGSNFGPRVTDVHIIYTQTGECVLWDDNLNFAAVFTASIIVNNALYVFGGMDASGAISNHYQYKMLSDPSTDPTTQPTISPANPSTFPSVSPSANPSESPVTKMPTLRASAGATQPTANKYGEAEAVESTESSISGTQSESSNDKEKFDNIYVIVLVIVVFILCAVGFVYCIVCAWCRIYVITKKDAMISEADNVHMGAIVPALVVPDVDTAGMMDAIVVADVTNGPNVPDDVDNIGNLHMDEGENSCATREDMMDDIIVAEVDSLGMDTIVAPDDVDNIDILHVDEPMRVKIVPIV